MVKQKIALDVIFRIYGGTRGREHLRGFRTSSDLRWRWCVGDGVMEVIRHGWIWNLTPSFPKATFCRPPSSRPGWAAGSFALPAWAELWSSSCFCFLSWCH